MSENTLNLGNLEVEALNFAAGNESLESMNVGQGINDMGASISRVCCTYACCSVEEE
jgi:hypothetical protein